MRGLNNYHDGLSAERGVARRYERAGGQVAARRWRGPSGEIDLVIRQGAEIIFVEVKKARDFARAAEHLTMRQLARIIATADEYIGSEPDGQLTQVRVDVALVNQAGETV
ncbi:MAG: YraN family protein, partial [Pseudomonadota bacterium]